jgi:WD40 repeat protein
MSNITITKGQQFLGHRDSVYTLQPGARDELFYSAGGDGMVVRWNFEHPDQGEVIATLSNSIYAMRVQPENNVAIVGHNYEGIHLIDLDGRREIGSMQLSKAAIFDIQSYGRFAFVASGDGSVRKIDLDDLTTKGAVFLSDKNARMIALYPDRGELAVGYSDHFIRVLDMDDLREKFSWRAHANSVFAVRYNPAGSVLLSVSRDARIKGWDVQADYAPVFEVVAHMYAINYLDFSPDGKHFVTCSMDKSMKVWDAASIRLLKVIDKARHTGHGTSVNRVLWSRYRDQLISASDDRTIVAWTIIF